MLCDSDRCTGCGACMQACPHDAIILKEDAETFVIPFVDENRCTDCRICEKKCPILNPPTLSRFDSPEAFLCWNLDLDARRKSASGGMFSVFADYVLEKNGVVFGAALNDDLKLSHVAVFSKESLESLRSSKYLQSEIGCSYIEVRRHLQENRHVLFVGTPCQVAGLYSFLGKTFGESEYLLACDLVCHGVPSQAVFRKFLEEDERIFKRKVTSVNFRSKKKDWRELAFLYNFSDGKQKIFSTSDIPFMRGYLSFLFYRQICYSCPFAALPRTADISLADHWGVAFDEKYTKEAPKGISLITVNSITGQKAFESCREKIYRETTPLELACRTNRNLHQPTRMSPLRTDFFNDFRKLSAAELKKKYLRQKITPGMLILRVFGRRFYMKLRSILLKYR